MNKYIIIAIIVVGLIGFGVAAKAFRTSTGQGNTVVETGETKTFRVVAVKDEWRFEPTEITVHKGDRVVIEVVNDDSYDHGIAIDSLGISQRMPANETITIEFLASREGNHQFYCSVPCGEGDVDGQHRTHFDMIGTINIVG